MSGKYILACDEHGDENWSSSQRTYTIGGFAIASSDRSNVVAIWNSIKAELCGNASVELKWRHFRPNQDQAPPGSPLLEQDTSKWAGQAVWALGKLLSRTSAFPICTVIRKDDVPQTDLSRTSRKGNPVLANIQVVPALIGQFALFLEDNAGSSGEIWFDYLGSSKEQIAFSDNISDLLYRAKKQPNNYQSMIARIDPNLRFFDSKEEPLIQVADFVSGLIWSAAEGDERYLASVQDYFAPGGKKTYGIALLK